MANTLKRLSGPTVPVKGGTDGAGTTLYTPSSGVTASVRNAVVASKAPWDAYISLYLNDANDETKILYNRLLIPAFRTVELPLDVIVANSGGDSIRARQTVPYQDTYGDATLLQTPAVLTNGTGNSAAATTVVTGSWTEVNGTLYMLSVAWRKAGGGITISSFTDTHAGITWTRIKNLVSGDLSVAVYAGVSTGTTAATTTVTFSAAPDAAGAAVTNVALTGTFDSTTANGTDGLVAFMAGTDPRSTTTPFLGGYSPTNSNRIVTAAALGTATTYTAATGGTELNDITTNMSMETAYLLGNGTGPSSVYLPTLAAGNGAHAAIGVEVQQPVSPLSVSLHGVEVT